MLGTGSILTDRLSASVLVDSSLLVDIPNGCMKSMRRAGLDPTSLQACLVTHMHADHFFDSVFLFLELGLRTSRSTPFVVVGPLGVEERLNQLFALSYPESWTRVRKNVQPVFHEIDENGGSLVVNAYSIRAVVVDHTVPLALGYLITDSEGKTLGVTGDSVMCPGVEEIAEQCDALVADASFLESRSGHMGLVDVERLAALRPEVPVMATHRTDEVKVSSLPNVQFPSDGDNFYL